MAEESVSTTATPEASGSTPAAGAVSGSTPASGSPPPDTTPKAATSSAKTVEAAPAQASGSTTRPDPSKFEWAKWNGEDWSAFPDDVRPWVQGIHGHLSAGHRTALEAAQADAELHRRALESLRWDDEDPRLVDANKARDAATKQFEDLRGKFSELEAARTKAESDLKAYLDEDAKKAIDDFKAQNQDFWTDENLKQKLVALMQEGWYFVDAAKLIRMGDEALTIAKPLFNEGVPGNRIVEFVEAKLAQKAPARPAPKPAAGLVAGSGPTNIPEVTEPTTAKNASFAEKRLAAINNAFKKVGVR